MREQSQDLVAYAAIAPEGFDGFVDKLLKSCCVDFLSSLMTRIRIIFANQLFGMCPKDGEAEQVELFHGLKRQIVWHIIKAGVGSCFGC